MSFEGVPTDQLEQRLQAAESEISLLRSEQVELLEEVDRRQIATGDGCKSLSDWVAARLDLSHDTAKGLVRTMRRTTDRSDLRRALVGGVSFDRVEALSRIREGVGLMEHLDVAGVYHQAALRARVTDDVESRSAADRFLVLQPSLDESWWKLWGGFDAYSGAIIDKVLSEAADQLPEEGAEGDSSWRRATALVQCLVSDDPPPAQVTVFVDTRHAVSSAGEAGVVLESGPRVGRQALEAVLCDSVTEVVGRAEDGRHMSYGRSHRIVPPVLHRALVHRYHGVCAIDGCNSRNRLQAHHIIPWARGGVTDEDNLVLLCWYHHHIAIHQQGLELYTTPEGRTRLRRPVTIHGP
jgi:hypothetical protein